MYHPSYQCPTKEIKHVSLQPNRRKQVLGFLPPPPTSALGLRLCNNSLRIAVGLRLGSPLCTPHLCPLCGSHIDASGVHALSCRSSKGRLCQPTSPQPRSLKVYAGQMVKDWMVSPLLLGPGDALLHEMSPVGTLLPNPHTIFY